MNNFPRLHQFCAKKTLSSSLATAAVERASQTLRDLRVAEVVQLDMQLENGKVINYRAKVKVSFKFEG